MSAARELHENCTIITQESHGSRIRVTWEPHESRIETHRSNMRNHMKVAWPTDVGAEDKAFSVGFPLKGGTVCFEVQTKTTKDNAQINEVSPPREKFEKKSREKIWVIPHTNVCWPRTNEISYSADSPEIGEGLQTLESALKGIACFVVLSLSMLKLRMKTKNN